MLTRGIGKPTTYVLSTPLIKQTIFGIKKGSDILATTIFINGKSSYGLDVAATKCDILGVQVTYDRIRESLEGNSTGFGDVEANWAHF